MSNEHVVNETIQYIQTTNIHESPELQDEPSNLSFEEDLFID